MPLKLYNTLTRKKEIFKPLRKNRVGLYTCGPTVYNYAHIGNLRTYIFQDVLKRTLNRSGFSVKHIMNTTDVDNKTIRASIEAGKSLKEFTVQYEKFFIDDLKKLHIELPTELARATEHIPSMIALIRKLLAKKVAYKKDGSVYFDISKFKPYGKLAHLDKKGLKDGARADVDEYSKDEVRDFVLWKGKKQSEPSWPAPFGKGRPGWHIECSAMSMQYLGTTFDLHTAGVDLIFPHHENEIAQSEAATGKKFVRYWVHGEHLLVNGEKMAKSLGNFFTLRDIEAKHIDPLAYRYLVLSAHYRSKLNFTWESLTAAEQAYKKLATIAIELKKNFKKNIVTSKEFKTFKKKFDDALANDLNTPIALSVVWTMLGSDMQDEEKYTLLLDFDTVLGLGLKDAQAEKIPAPVMQLVKRREIARQSKQWQEADELRKKIHEQGYAIEDTSEGPKIKSV